MPVEVRYTPLMNPLVYYQARLEEIQAGLVTLEAKQSMSAGVLGLALLLFVMVGFIAINKRSVPLWYPPLSLSAVFVSARNYGRRQAARLRFARLRDFHARGVARLQDDWMGKGETGEEFAAEGHLYAQDLNLFGYGSVFERLCITRTRIGARKLAAYLQSAPTAIDECMARQAAVKELRGATELREAMAGLGKEFNQASWETFSAWLDHEPESFAPWMRVVAPILAGLTITSLCLAIAGIVPPVLCVPIVATQVALGGALREKVLRVIERSWLLGVEIGLLSEGLSLLAGQRFEASKLQELSRRAVEPGEALRRLTRLLNLMAEREKEWFYFPLLLLMAGSQSAMAVEAWRLRHGADFARWIDGWAEFEALNALGCYAFECPADAFPSFQAGAPVFEAVGLGHPLLPAAACTRNDVHLNDNVKLLLISGSNMAGKSTLMRTIGLAAVLAAAGAPVRARRLRLSLFSTCASLSIQDAIQEGRSKFKAELDRLRDTITRAQTTPPVLFLIDEVFGGTNSRDRRVAAEAVLRTLVSAGAVGAVSTHDLSLTEIAGLEGIGGINVHMGSRPGGGPLDFDYLLKPGVTTETNALAIARLAGVPV